jgi:hypothetical protein
VAPDSVSLAGKNTVLPIPASGTDLPEREVAQDVSSIAERPLTPVKGQGATTAKVKAASDSVRREGPFVANQSVWLNPSPLRDSVTMAYVADKHSTPPQQVGPPIADPFQALDAERSGPATWISAGAHHAEAGFLDPAFGWISVRADAARSGVHAAVLPPSGEAAQVLGSHLAGLNAYLSEHQREPATVTMAAPQDGRDGTGMGPGTHAGQGDSASHEGAHERQWMNNEASASVPRVLHQSTSAESATTPIQAAVQAGKHISVVA